MMALIAKAAGKSLGAALLDGTFVAVSVSTVRESTVTVAMPVMVLPTPAEVYVRGRVVLSLLFER